MGRSMRLPASLLALLLLLPAAVHAASPEEAYLAARDGYIKRFNSKEWGEADLQKATQQELGARRDLERQMSKIVGAPDLKNFSADGRLNLDTLLRGEMGFGLLDGMAYTRDDKARAVVTTDGLLKAWLRGHRNWNPKGPNVLQDADKVLQTDLFYTQAISTDAAVVKYAEIPVAKAPGFATAMLAARAQDIGPRAPVEVIVAAMRGGRVFIVSAPAAAKIEPMADCKAIWDEAAMKAGEAFEKYQASGLKDKRQLALQAKIEEEGAAAFRRCYAERAPRDAAFAGLAAQAAALLDLLPAK